MHTVSILLTLSAVIGFALGISFSWFAIATSSAALAALSSAALHIQGFGVVLGIAIVTACVTVHQIGFLVGVCGRHRSQLIKRPTRNVAGE